LRKKIEEMNTETSTARAEIEKVVAVTDGDIAVRGKTTAYLDAVLQLLADLDLMLAPDRKPNAEAAKARGQDKKAAEAAWRALGGS
jgi:hypothetical protein